MIYTGVVYLSAVTETHYLVSSITQQAEAGRPKPATLPKARLYHTNTLNLYCPPTCHMIHELLFLILQKNILSVDNICDV